MTSKTAPAFTEGPWTTARAHARPDGTFAVGPGDTAGIAIVTGAANARLIESSPAMYEALRALLDEVALDGIYTSPAEKQAGEVLRRIENKGGEK